MSTEKNRIAILELMKQPGNNTCADCGKPNPEWASASKGLFICITCSSFHRSLGTSISVVKSLKLDTWTDEKLKLMEEHGNVKGNGIWAKQVPLCYRRPKPTDPEVLREEWIRAKYERQEFIAGAPHPAYLSGSMKGHLQKKGKGDSSWNSRLFVLSEPGNYLCYYIKDEDKEPKQSLNLTEINVTFADFDRTNKKNSLQITYVSNGRTRNYFVCQDSGKEIVSWYMAIRSAKLNFLKYNKPGIDMKMLSSQLTRDFIMEGFLEKTGPKDGAWQRRWFSLDRRRLLYFKEPMDAEPKGELILGTEGFEVEEGVSLNKHKYDEYCFTLTTPDRDYLLKAKIESDRKMWMDCISRVLAQPMTQDDMNEMSAALTATKKRKGSLPRRFRRFSRADDDSP